MVYDPFFLVLPCFAKIFREMSTSEKMPDKEVSAVTNNTSPVSSNANVDGANFGNGYIVNENGELMLDNGLKPGLKNRMINLMAICGILGPGVFVGMGSMLKTGGGAGTVSYTHLDVYKRQELQQHDGVLIALFFYKTAKCISSTTNLAQHI